jgi:hypothetical protein
MKHIAKGQGVAWLVIAEVMGIVAFSNSPKQRESVVLWQYKREFKRFHGTQ